MVLSLYTIWLLWVEETQKSTQSSGERHRAEFIIVVEMESLEGHPVKSSHVLFSLRVTVTIIPYGSVLSHTLNCSYSTHCPISKVLRGLMSCHFCLSCPFQCLSFYSVTSLCPSFSPSSSSCWSQSSSEPAAPLSPFIQKGRPEEKGLSDGEKPLKGGRPASRCKWGKKAGGAPLWWSERSCKPSLCPALWWWEGGSSGGA